MVTPRRSWLVNRYADLNHPANYGFLLSCVRGAWDDQKLVARLDDPLSALDQEDRYIVEPRASTAFTGDNEFEALVLALEGAPE